VSNQRDLDWDGCYNVRDLGGLPTIDGRTTRWGAVIRADAPSGLTEAGWRAARDHGVATIIDLMEAHERRPDTASRPDGLTEIHVPIDGTDDGDFWAPLRANGHWGTVLYYSPFLERFPDRIATAVRAFADAPAGGILLHCGRGRDRTGLVSMVLLSLAGVRPAAIVEDYLASDSDRIVGLRAALGLPDDTTNVEAIYQRAGTTSGDALAQFVRSLDAESVLLSGGLAAHDLDRVRTRLVD
jgi:protein tyrosine/serine phosphatase